MLIKRKEIAGSFMKPIDKGELYNHLSDFLKARGVELKDGSYAQRVQKGCNLLADSINLTQAGMERTKAEIDKQLERMRQVIHERTAPAPPGKPGPAEAKSAASPPSAAAKSTTSTKAKTKRPNTTAMKARK
jgi:hypothetical protein